MKDKIQYKIINLGAGVDITIKDLANLIAKKLDSIGDFQWDGVKSEGVKAKNV